MSSHAPHETYQPSSISASPLFEAMLEFYNTVGNEVVNASEYAPDTPLYPRYDAVGDAFHEASAALYAVIDAHCALEVWKAVHRLTEPLKDGHAPSVPQMPTRSEGQPARTPHAQEAQAKEHDTPMQEAPPTTRSIKNN